MLCDSCKGKSYMKSERQNSRESGRRFCLKPIAYRVLQSLTGADMMGAWPGRLYPFSAMATATRKMFILGDQKNDAIAFFNTFETLLGSVLWAQRKFTALFFFQREHDDRNCLSRCAGQFPATRNQRRWPVWTIAFPACLKWGLVVRVSLIRHRWISIFGVSSKIKSTDHNYQRIFLKWGPGSLLL